MSDYVRDLVDDIDPILRETMPEFEFTPDTAQYAVQLAQTLGESMLAHGGVGLSANQIGLRERAFAIRSNPVMVCFNPRIVDVSQEEVVLDEGCLSFPGVFLKINRVRHIRVRFTDPTGVTHTEKFTGVTARAFLHELDHLNGVVFLDHVGKVAKDIARRKLVKAKKVQKLRNQFRNAARKA